MKREVIIALDFPTKEEMLKFLDKFDRQLFVKVGLELYLQYGKDIVKEIKNRGHKIFLDLKLHDIPNTVYGAAKGLADLNVDILTVHCAGGIEMMKAAKEGIGNFTKVVGVTQLTSTSEENMKKEQLLNISLKESVLNYANLAKTAGLDGIVCSVYESNIINEKFGEEFIKITPAIRLLEDNNGDQKRVATPEMAKEQKSTYIVVGRSITKSNNPLEVYEKIVNLFE